MTNRRTAASWSRMVCGRCLARGRRGNALYAGALHRQRRAGIRYRKARTLFPAHKSPCRAVAINLADASGWTISTWPPRRSLRTALPGVFRASRAGAYPSLWPGLHASMKRPCRDRRGMLIGTTRCWAVSSIPGSNASPCGGEWQHGQHVSLHRRWPFRRRVFKDGAPGFPLADAACPSATWT